MRVGNRDAREGEVEGPIFRARGAKEVLGKALWARREALSIELKEVRFTFNTLGLILAVAKGAAGHAANTLNLGVIRVSASGAFVKAAEAE
jgi:hypothetical protein